MKKVFIVLLTLVLVLAMVPSVAMAAGTNVADAAQLTTALTAGGDITLMADIDAGDIVQGSFFAVPGGKTVTLDLNGHTLQGTRIDGTITSGNRNTAIITNNGTLTIQDTLGGGQMIIDSTNDDAWNSCIAVVSNIGTLTINSGTLQNNGLTSMSYVVDNLSGSGNPVVNVNGGTLKSTNYIAIRLFANSTTMTNTVNINGGTIYGYKRGIWIQQPSASNGIATINVSGGTVEAGIQAAILADLLGTDGVDINITGGTLTNHSDARATLAISLDGVATAGGANVMINGGTLLNTGTAGNIGDYTTGGTATPSVIMVYAGTFSAIVPDGYIAAGADPDDIIIGSATDVIAGVDPTYIITIPATVNFGTLVKDTGIKLQDFDIIASGVLIESGASIDVKVSSPFAMYDQDGTGSIPLNYSLISDSNPTLVSGGLFASLMEARTENGTISVNTANITMAGSYSGTMNFTLSYVV